MGYGNPFGYYLKEAADATWQVKQNDGNGKSVLISTHNRWLTAESEVERLSADGYAQLSSGGKVERV